MPIEIVESDPVRTRRERVISLVAGFIIWGKRLHRPRPIEIRISVDNGRLLKPPPCTKGRASQIISRRKTTLCNPSSILAEPRFVDFQWDATVSNTGQVALTLEYRSRLWAEMGLQPWIRLGDSVLGTLLTNTVIRHLYWPLYSISSHL